jgi:hypothetical protein
MLNDRIATERRAHADLLSLLKAYARLGYRQANTGLDDDGFEQLWNAAFPDDESEDASPADARHPEFPRSA